MLCHSRKDLGSFVIALDKSIFQSDASESRKQKHKISEMFELIILHRN